MSSFKRAIGAAAVSALLVSSTAIAADMSPLPAGKPAGTKEAALLGAPFLLIGGAIIIAIIAIAASNGGNDNPTTPTTSTTTTTSTATSTGTAG
jgi:hypothetical protein